MSKTRKKASPPSSHELALTLYQAFKRSNDVMFYCDRDGTILDVNDAFERHYGWTRAESIGQNPRLLRSRYTNQDTYKEMWAKILDPKVGFWRGELVNRSKDGREIPLILTITAVRGDDGDILGYISNAMDIGELRRLQERVAQSEALAQLGQMGAVVAHEIRNPLGSIVMAARQLAGGELARDDRDLVHKILRDESQRLSETLTNFLSYARPRPLKLERADVNALVADVARIVAGDGNTGAKVATKLEKGLAPFRFDPDQIRQVLWNIALNAVQAAGAGGTVRLATARAEGFALLRVSDDGPGIAPEARDELFMPFKTTKAHGTGLGLAIADRIVRAHGGRIEAKNGASKGAEFTVYLPTAQA